MLLLLLLLLLLFMSLLCSTHITLSSPSCSNSRSSNSIWAVVVVRCLFHIVHTRFTIPYIISLSKILLCATRDDGYISRNIMDKQYIANSLTRFALLACPCSDIAHMRTYYIFPAQNSAFDRNWSIWASKWKKKNNNTKKKILLFLSLSFSAVCVCVQINGNTKQQPFIGSTKHTQFLAMI